MLPEEGYDEASYLVGYGGSGHAYALHLHSLRFICIDILCWHEVKMRGIAFIMNILYSYVEVVYLLYIMPFISLWKFYWISCIMLTSCQCHWINKLIISYYFHLLYIPLLLNQCLIKL